MYNQLDLILKRILPLRNTGGHEDRVVFLGDYIDRRFDSHKVVDRIIQLKKKYPEQVITLLGNHELLLMESCDPEASVERYKMWMHNGGEETLLGYMRLAGSEVENPYLIRREHIRRFIPDEHMEFFECLDSFYETDKYMFVHGGCDPFIPLQYQSAKLLAWDRSVYHNMWNLFENKAPCPWDKTIVTGHNGECDGKPFVWDKFMMLDGSKAERLYVFELNSREGFSARKNKKRLVKESIT